MPYTPIVGTLGFVLSPDRLSTLLVHRTARADDDQRGKYNGLGGKMEVDEDIATCMQREIHEESGLTGLSMTLRGTINWTGLGAKEENWLGFIFLIERFEGEPFRENDDGSLAWHRIDRLHELPMWEGDREFLPMVFDDDPRCFHGHMPYQGDRPLGFSYQRI